MACTRIKRSQGVPGRTGNLFVKVARTKRPNRRGPRKYTAQDAARICCYAVGSGALPEMIQFYAGCCLPSDERKDDAEDRLHRLMAAMAAIALALAAISGVLSALGALVGGLVTASVRNELRYAIEDLDSIIAQIENEVGL